MKRIISLLFVIAMVLSCTCTAMADTKYTTNYYDKYTSQKKGVGIIHNGRPLVKPNAGSGGINEAYKWGGTTPLELEKGSACIYDWDFFSLLEEFGDMSEGDILSPEKSEELWNRIPGYKRGTDSASLWAFKLFGKHWYWYEVETIINQYGYDYYYLYSVEENRFYPIEYVYTLQEHIKSHGENDCNIMKVAPTLRTLGYNVSWNKARNSIVVTSPDYKGDPNTILLSDYDKKALDWCIENGYLFTDKNGTVDYTQPISQEWFYNWVAQYYGMDYIKDCVRKKVKEYYEFSEGDSVKIPPNLGIGRKAMWALKWDSTKTDGFTFELSEDWAASYLGVFYKYPERWKYVPRTWPEEDSKYIYFFLNDGGLFKLDLSNTGFLKTSIFEEGLYGRAAYNRAKGLEYPAYASSNMSLWGFQSLQKPNIERYNDILDFFFNIRYELVKKYEESEYDLASHLIRGAGGLNGVNNYALYDLQYWLSYEPIMNRFFKGTEWKEKVKYNSNTYGQDVLEWARIFYAWNTIPYENERPYHKERYDDLIDKTVKETIIWYEENKGFERI